MSHFLIIAVAGIAGLSYFVYVMGHWLLAGLFLATVATRFIPVVRDFGKFVQFLFLFCLVAFGISELGIAYPYSLILILAGLMCVIFYEGPEWGRLYFGFGRTAQFFKTALLYATFFAALFGLAIYYSVTPAENPVPLSWPVDALFVVGIGFACYMAIVEETIFRSFILQRAEAAAGGVSAVVAQGLFYGFMYFKVGVPSGAPGAVTGALFGMALGHLVKKSDSIYLAMFVHFLVTLFVFIELTLLGKFYGN